MEETYYLDAIRKQDGAGDPERALTSPNGPTHVTTGLVDEWANPEGTLTRPLCPACGSGSIDYTLAWWECDVTRNARQQYFSGEPRLAQVV